MADESQPAPSFGRRFNHQVRVHRLLLSILTFAIGILLTVLAIGYFTPISSVAPFTQINQVTAQGNQTNYNLVFVIAGPIVSIIGAYFVGAYYIARRRFEHLMETKSKAEFLRNLPEIEDILWDLTPNDEQRYLDKRADLRIRH